MIGCFVCDSTHCAQISRLTIDLFCSPAGGCVGYPATDTEIRVVDVDADAGDIEREPLERGQVGLVLARGKQVMRGYYNNKRATEKAIDRFGWFNTEDLGYINPATGDLFINGRAKDTVRSLRDIFPMQKY